MHLFMLVPGTWLFPKLPFSFPSIHCNFPFETGLALMIPPSLESFIHGDQIITHFSEVQGGTNIYNLHGPQWQRVQRKFPKREFSI